MCVCVCVCCVGAAPEEEESALGKLVQAAATSFFTHAYASEDDKETKVQHIITLSLYH